MSVITEANFADLYLGADFNDVKGLEGADARLVSAPASWEQDVIRLRERCMTHFTQVQDPEFSLIEDERVLRITTLKDPFDQLIFVVRKSNAIIRKFDLLGFPSEVASTLMDQHVRGLVVFCGEMATGKTSSAASLVVERLKSYGGIAIAVEDPQDTNLSGLHGKGRCIQMQVSRLTGGYEETLVRALRTNADLILIGEIRDTASAVQAVRASINGHLIITTSHSGSPAQSIERIAALAQPVISNAREILSQGLTAVVCQTLEGTGPQKILKIKSLILNGKDGPGIREKIRAGDIPHLDQDVEIQSMRSLWND